MRYALFVLIVKLAYLLASAASSQAGIREASGKFNNAGTCGSFTFVARDGNTLYGITCAHGFRGVIGGQFDIETWNASKGKATLLDIDRERDIALFSVGAGGSVNIDVVPIGESDPDESCPVTLSGFPDAGQFKTVQGSWDSGKAYYADQSLTSRLYRFHTSGILGQGASGGSVVQNGKLIGVISATSAAGATDSFTCDYSSLYKFSSKERTRCFGGVCKRVRIVQRGKTVQPLPSNKKQVFVQPVPPPIPEPDQPPPIPSDPAKPSPPDLSVIQSQLDEIKQQLAGSAARPGERGPQGLAGATGPAGPAGKDADPAKLSALEKRLAAIETFQNNLAGSRVTVPVRPVKTPAPAK